MQAPDQNFEGGGSGGSGGSAAGAVDFDTLVSQTEQYAREEPAKAVGYAFAAGLVLTLLPVGLILSGILRLALMLVRPALLVLGAVKLYEEIDKRQNS